MPALGLALGLPHGGKVFTPPSEISSIVEWFSIDDLSALSQGAAVNAWTGRVLGWEATGGSATYDTSDPDDGLPYVQAVNPSAALSATIVADFQAIFASNDFDLWFVAKLDSTLAYQTDPGFCNLYTNAGDGIGYEIMGTHIDYGGGFYISFPANASYVTGTVASVEAPYNWLYRDNWHVFRVSKHGTTRQLEMDGVTVWSTVGNSATLAPTAKIDMYVIPANSQLRLRHVAYFNEFLQGDDETNTRAFFDQYRTVHVSPLEIWTDGDSITWGNGGDNATYAWPGFVQTALGGSKLVRNVALSGQTIDDMAADAATEIDANFTAGAILVAWEYYNQASAGTSAANIYSKLSAYCTARRAAGFKVIVMTDFHNNTASDPTVGTRCHDASELVRAGWAGFADALVDLDLQSLRDDAALTDTIHPTAAGHQIIADLMAPTILALI